MLPQIAIKGTKNVEYKCLVSCVKLLVLKWGFMWKEQNGSKPQLLSRQL
jgi:hypothetical protein